VAWATPVILTMSASGAQAQVVSCVKAGSACGVGSPTPTNPCCDTTGAYCCCEERKGTTITRTCVLVTKCVSQGTTQRSCISGL
jgi:hypothetical protein